MSVDRSSGCTEAGADIALREKEKEASVDKITRALGVQIQALRNASGIAAGKLAEAAGISHSMLSRIERGLATPSVETLAKISVAMGIPLSRFFVDQTERFDCSYVPAGSGVTVERAGSAHGHVYRLLGHGLSGSLFVEPYLVTLPEGAEPWSTFQATGVEFIHVLEGTMTYRCSDFLYKLGPGDSMLFDAHALHGPEEIGPGQVKFLITMFNVREVV